MNTSRWATKSNEPVEVSRTPATTNTPESVAPTVTVEPASKELFYHQSSYIPQDESIDEFAQTRPPDDLFDDDFIPIDEPIPAEIVVPTVVEEIPLEPVPSQAPPSAPRVRGAPRGPRRGNNTSRHASATARADATPSEPVTTVEADTAEAVKPEKRETAVRGDRSGTGGPKRSKLTEEQLSAKLDAMKLKNATLMEKHEKSQADEELFHQREAVAAEKRKEERANRQQMMGERERNRLRKLKAQGGREWDIEKDEKEFGGGDRRGNRRGAHGGIVSDRPAAATPEEPSEDYQRSGAVERGRGRGRGRGGRGDSSGRGRGAQATAKSKSAPEQAIPTSNDFPDLPTVKKSAPSTSTDVRKTLESQDEKPNQKTEAQTLAAIIGPGEKTSWADQVEQST